MVPVRFRDFGLFHQGFALLKHPQSQILEEYSGLPAELKELL